MCYYTRASLPDGPPSGLLTVKPDLVVEVISPDDLAEEISMRLKDYVTGGIPQSWIIYPKSRSVTVFWQNRNVRRLTEEDLLSGEDISPGIECMISDLFPPIR
jgi:Uma2 family endonuclease